MKSLPSFLRRLLVSCLGLAGVGLASAQGTLPVTDGLVLQLDAGKGVADTLGKTPDASTRISRWVDQASLQGSNAAMPPSFAVGPYYLASVPELNGRPALDFRNDAQLQSGISVSETNVSWFVVFRADFSASDVVVGFSRQTGTLITPSSGGQVIARGWRSTGGSFNIDAPLNNLASRKQEFFIQSAWRANADVIAQRLTDRQKQVLTASNTLANAANTSVLNIGGEAPSGGPFSGQLSGQIAEILVYNRALTTTERTSVEDYLYNKYFGPADSDADSLPDEWEIAKFGVLGQTAEGDADGDLLTNRKEFEAGSNPALADSDGDGLDDAREVAAGSNPLSADSDGDLASDPLELLAKSNPTSFSSTPARIFSGLILHSDMESGTPSDFSLRNLAGPGRGIATLGSGDTPSFRAEGISGEGLQLPGGLGLDFGAQAVAANGPFTLSLAFRPDAGTGLRYLASQGNRDLTRPGWSLYLDDQGLVLRAMDSIRSRSTSFRHAGPFTAGTWYQVAFSYTADGSLVPYLNGSTAGWSGGTAVPGGLSGGPGSTLLLGLSDAQSFPFTGNLDEFSLWSRVLGGSEISDLHTKATGGIGLNGESRNAAPAFTTEPQPAMVFTGQSFELAAQAPGATLKWLKNGGNLAGKTTGSLLVNPSTTADAARYSIQATFANGVRPSPEALVRVTDFRANQVFKTPGPTGQESTFQIGDIAVEGDGMAVGVPLYQPGSSNPNARGRVHFLRRSTTNRDQWSFAQTIDVPVSTQQYFGWDVALQGNTLVVGAYNSNTFGELRTGRVYIYTRTNTAANWTLQQQISSPAPVDNDSFGVCLALDGTTLVIGSSGAEKAFVYEFSGGSWVLSKTLEPPATAPGRTLTYGAYLSLQGDNLVVGDERSRIAADNLQGAAYIYQRNAGGAGQWGMTQKLKAQTPVFLDGFGRGVALDGGTLVVNNPQTASIDIYSFSSATGQAAFLVALPKPIAPGVPGAEQPLGAIYGRNLSLSGDYLVVGNSNDGEFGGGAGATFVFRRDPGSTMRWTLVKKIIADDTTTSSGFGSKAVLHRNEIFATAGTLSTSNPSTLYGFRISQLSVPEVLGAPRTLADTGKEYRYDLSVRVAPGAAPQISAASPLPSWLSLERTGLGLARLSGTPPVDAAGEYPIRLLVTEPNSLPATQEFTLHVLPGNLQPLLVQSRVELAADEDAAPFTVDLHPLIIDGEDAFTALDLQLSGVPVAGPFSAAITNGLLTVTPLPDANGSGEFKVRATDRGGLFSEITVPVEIAPVNDKPTATALPAILVDAAATPVTRDLSGFFNDVDLTREGDELSFSIVANTAPELFTTVQIDPNSGQLSLAFAPYRSGDASLTIRATDRAGLHAEEVLLVSVPAIPPPAIGFTSTLALNRQTGLYEQRITFTNSGPRAMGGFDLTITGLPQGVVVNNASSTGAGTATIAMRRPLEPGASVTIVIEYLVPGRNPNFTPQISLSVTLPDPPPAAIGASFAIDRMLRLEDGSFLIEFSCEPGHHYEMQYSDDGTVWKSAATKLTAAGNRLQWIDRGPPATDKHPSQATMRFYRVSELP